MSRRRAVPWVLVLLALGACRSSNDAAARRAATTSVAPATTVPATVTSVAPTTAPPTTQAGPQPCPAAGLALAHADSRVALGNALFLFRLRNTSSQACRLEGHPAITLLDTQGRTLGRAKPGAGHILPERPPRPVSLAPGASAWFGVEATALCEGDAAPTPSARASVTPPGDTGTVTVTVTIDVCPNGSVLVSPVRATEREVAA